MTDRAEIDRLVRDAYAARIRGDVEAIISMCDPGFQFELVGDKNASPVPVRAAGIDEFRTILANLVRNFTFLDHEVLTLVTNGTRTAVRSRATITATATGRRALMELADFVEIKDGRLVSFVPFCDTAAAARLLTI